MKIHELKVFMTETKFEAFFFFVNSYTLKPFHFLQMRGIKDYLFLFGALFYFCKKNSL